MAHETRLSFTLLSAIRKPDRAMQLACQPSPRCACRLSIERYETALDRLSNCCGSAQGAEASRPSPGAQFKRSNRRKGRGGQEFWRRLEPIWRIRGGMKTRFRPLRLLKLVESVLKKLSAGRAWIAKLLARELVDTACGAHNYAASGLERDFILLQAAIRDFADEMAQAASRCSLAARWLRPVSHPDAGEGLRRRVVSNR